MKPDLSTPFFAFFYFYFTLLISHAMLSYDRSSHSPIQVAVISIILSHSPIKLYGSRPILNYGLLRPRGPPGSTVFDLDH